MAKILSYVMLVLLNVITEPSNVRKKKERKLSDVTKVLSYVILILSNVMMELLSVSKN